MRVTSCSSRSRPRFTLDLTGVRVLAISDGKIVGFALWLLLFGTFSGRYGLWVANIYVEESYRGIEIGLALFRHMARIAVAKDCATIQWDVNEWNTQAIEFYDRIGAHQ
jgi:GNAT superfamily N-acetyltransferase